MTAKRDRGRWITVLKYQRAAAELLREVDEKRWLERVKQSPIIHKLKPEERLRLAMILITDRNGTELAADLLQGSVAGSSKEARIDVALKNTLVIALIGARRFEDAMKEIADSRAEILTSNDITETFNFAMAEWGATGIAPEDLFAHTLVLASTDAFRDPNRLQCLALANFICGNIDAARADVAKARERMGNAAPQIFSCWSYLQVGRAEMLSDLNSLEEYIMGVGPAPAIVQRSLLH